MSWASEFRKSIKSPEAEDRFDLIFYRPLGFVLAKLGWAAGLHPTHLTLAGAAAGVAAGGLFFVGEGAALAWAVALFVLAGVLDSADGQLARLSGRSTPFGLVLDGLCDNVVFGAVYAGCTAALLGRCGPGIWLLALAAGISHSLQSSLLDFYNREFLFYTGGEGRERYWNPLVREERGRGGWVSRLRITWLWQQQLLSVRPPELRLELRGAAAGAGAAEVYRRHNARLLHLWRPLGANVHTAAIIAFAAAGRFELYLLLVDILALNLWLVACCWVQFWADRAMLRELGLAP